MGVSGCIEWISKFRICSAASSPWFSARLWQAAYEAGCGNLLGNVIVKLLYAAEKQRISILSPLLISKPRDLREKSGAERAVCIFRARRRGRRQKERQKLQDAVIVNILQQTLQQGLCGNRLFVRLTACERAVSRSMMPLCLQETAGPAEQ